jgi:H+/Cl- antiporter ClcA
VSNALGLLAFVCYVLIVVGVAAGVTWVVVKLTPTRKPSGDTQT